MPHFAHLVVILWATAAASPLGAAEPAQTQGQALYISKGCYQCHGYGGQGSSTTGPRIAGTPLTYEAFAELVRRPVNVMPAYSPRVLKDQELRDLHAFVVSMR
jgi:ubiquinol-cytochrome c reductase cytochrome c subunit